ncbi:uncharacterized protein LOC135224349 isoform X2 [Macrobrachium nipponense]|uniref:uncharacterized protein LOC135224349 isoform X2 n=1 Tax=Macrobrachium nipponense TaxID=159736 RepID=UPI0030C7CCF3
MYRYQNLDSHSPGHMQSSFQSLIHRNRTRKKAIIIGGFGSLLMMAGIISAIFGISGLGGLILILLGALSMVTGVIISNRACSDYNDIPSISGGVVETQPRIPVDQQPQNPNWNSSGEYSSGQDLGYSYRHSLFFTDNFGLPTHIVSHSAGSVPSAPPMSNKTDEHPPSYEELFSKK